MLWVKGMLNAQVMPGKEHHRKGHFPASLHLWNLHREEKETVGAESKREKRSVTTAGVQIGIQVTGRLPSMILIRSE